MTVNTMIRPLRIKEDDTLLETTTQRGDHYKCEVERLKALNPKIQDQLDTERNNSIGLYKKWAEASKNVWTLQGEGTTMPLDLSTVPLAPESTDTTDQTSSDKKKFLSQGKCIELEDPVDPLRLNMYLLDSLLKQIPLYGAECVQFVNTYNLRLLAVQMKMYAAIWEIWRIFVLNMRG